MDSIEKIMADNMAQQRTSATEKLNKLVTALKAYPEVEFVLAQYSGSGDSGQVDEVEYVAGPQYQPVANSKVVAAAVDEELGAYGMDYLIDGLLDGNGYGGWEINEGSEGVVKIDVAKRTFTITHTNYEPDSDESEDEFDL
jgi:hypothetical protein